MIPRVWAPRARARRPGARRRAPAAAGRRAVVDGARPTCRTAPTTRSRSTAATPGRTRAAPGSRTACTAPAACSTPRRFTWTDDGWLGVDVRGHVTYELHVGTFSPGGTLSSAVEHLDELVSLGRGPGRAHAGRPVQRRARLGVRRGGRLRRARAVRRPGRAAGVRRRRARPRSGGVPRRRPQPPGPVGQLSRHVRPVLHRTRTRRPGARRSTWTAPGSDEVRRWICDSALRWFRDFHVDALRLDAVHALIDFSDRHLLAQLSDEVAELADELGPPAVAGRRVRPQRRRLGDADRAGRLGHDGPVGRRRAPRGARAGHGRAARVLRATSAAPETLRTALTRVFVHDGGLSTFRGRDWGRPVPPEVDGHRFVVAASTHDQVGNRALGDRPSARLDPGRLAATRPRSCCSRRTRPMLFMGEEWGARTPWLFFTDHPEPGPGRGRARRPHAASSAGTAGTPCTAAPSRSRTRRTRRRSAASVLDRSELDDPAHPEHARLRDWYRVADRPAPRGPRPALRRPAATDLLWGGATCRRPDDALGRVARCCTAVPHASSSTCPAPGPPCRSRRDGPLSVGRRVGRARRWTPRPTAAGPDVPARSVVVLA